MVIKNIKLPKTYIFDAPATSHISTKYKYILISSSVILSIVVVVIPHLSIFNPDGSLVGVDTFYYVEWVENINTTNLQLFINSLLQNEGDRPFTLFILYVYSNLTDLPKDVAIEYFPVLLSPLLTILIYFLAKEITSNVKIGIVSSLITPFSFYTLIGIYSGFYANWLGLVFGFSSVLFLYKLFNEFRVVNIVLFFLFMLILLGVHSHTWFIFMIFSVLISIIILRKNNKKSFLAVLSCLVLLVLADVSKFMIFSTETGTGKDLEILLTHIRGENLFLRWTILSQTVLIQFAGIFGNFVLLSLVIIWLYSSKYGESTKLLLIFLLIGIPGIIFGNWLLQSRIYYNIPFQIPVAIVLTRLYEYNKPMATTIFLTIGTIAVYYLTNF